MLLHQSVKTLHNKCNLHQTQDKAVKAESKRVEALMKKIALQQVQQEKEDGETRLLQAVEQTKRDFEPERQEAFRKGKEEAKIEADIELKNIEAERKIELVTFIKKTIVLQVRNQIMKKDKKKNAKKTRNIHLMNVSNIITKMTSVKLMTKPMTKVMKMTY